MMSLWVVAALTYVGMVLLTVHHESTRFRRRSLLVLVGRLGLRHRRLRAVIGRILRRRFRRRHPQIAAGLAVLTKATRGSF